MQKFKGSATCKIVKVASFSFQGLSTDRFPYKKQNKRKKRSNAKFPEHRAFNTTMLGISQNNNKIDTFGRTLSQQLRFANPAAAADNVNCK